MNRDISHFEQAHGLNFRDKGLLQTAFTHSSFVNEADDEELSDNERLEFLGDSILNTIVSEMLYLRFPESSEGDLTSVRASLVRKETLARFARQLQLGDYLRLGHGEDESGGRQRAATLCATFEAVVGAIYLDQGVGVVRQFVLPLVEVDFEPLRSRALSKDPKSRLQEWAQSNLGAPPRYPTVAADGPDHAKLFTIEVLIDKRRYGVGQGRNKQEGGQAAAAMALAKLNLEAPEYVPNPEVEAQYPLDGEASDE